MCKDTELNMLLSLDDENGSVHTKQRQPKNSNNNNAESVTLSDGIAFA